MSRIALGLVGMWLRGGLSCAQAERRVSLVVGSAAYTDRPLRNPFNDARLTQAMLCDLGIEVQVATEAGRPGVLDALRDFEARARGAEVVTFYFAGQGSLLAPTP